MTVPTNDDHQHSVLPHSTDKCILERIFLGWPTIQKPNVDDHPFASEATVGTVKALERHTSPHPHGHFPRQ